MSGVIDKIKSRLKGERPLLGGAISRVRPSVTTEELIGSERRGRPSIRFQDESEIKIKSPINKNIPEEFEKYIGIKNINSSCVYRLNDVELIGEYAIPVTKNGKYVLEEIARESTLRELLGKTSDKFFLTKVFGPKVRSKIRNIRQRIGDSTKYKESAIINLVPRHFGGENHSSQGNYGHWVAEDLPRLKGFEEYKNKEGIEAKILIMKDPPSWMTETLKLLGYSESDWYEWDQESAVISSLVVPELYHFHSRNTDLNPCGRRWVSKNIKKNVNINGGTELPKRIFPSRQGSGFRKIANFKEVKSVLDEFGIVPIRNEDMSVSDQVRLYSQAELIVGPFGANLTNIIFASNSSVIEIFDYDDIRPVYFVTASERGLDYAYITGEKNEGGANIFVKPEKLLSVLAFIMSQ